MKVTVVVVGKARGLLAPAIAEYEARAARYWRLDVVEVESGAGRGDASPREVREAEAGRLLPRLPDGAEVFALTREGRGMSSRALASRLSELAVRASPGAAFVIGGAHGLAPRLLRKARRRLSLSAMTLPHEMARLVLMEQLYRAGTISRREPYHKEGA